jgi:glycosyltransferase involved in cell wall biosynthesis
VQPWGVDTALFTADRRDDDWRRSVSAAEGPVFLANRHLHELFRHDVLVRATAALARETGRFSVVLVGGGSAEAALRALAGDAAPGRVHFTGRVPPDEMPRCYASADVYVDCFPSQGGGHGASLSLFEAMACGLPVIVANRPGLEDLVGDAGFLFPPNDSKALAEIMRRFIEDPSLGSAMGRRAVERARTTADRDQNLRRFEARMEGLIAARRATGCPAP